MKPTTVKKHHVRARSSRAAALAALAAGLGVSFASPDASASGFLGARFGSDYGNPVGPNPFSIYFNPAAIAAAKGTQISVDGALVWRRASYDRPASALSPNNSNAQPDAAELKANSGKNTLSDLITLPFLGATSDLGTNFLHVGLASYIPFGGQGDWDRDSSFRGTSTPGAVDGPNRWFNISGRILSLYNTAAASVTIPGTTLSIGLNGSYVLSQAHTVRARNADGSDDTRNFNGSLKEGRALIEVSGAHFAGGVGLYWEPIPQKLALGASFSARPNFGQMRMKGTLRTQLGVQAQEGPPQDVELLQTLPDVWRFGASYRINKSFLIRGDVEYVTWSHFKRQCLVQVGGKCRLDETGREVESNGDQVIQVIDRGWHDAGGVRIGLVYNLSDETEIFGSGGVDTSAVPLETLDPTFIDSTKLLGVIGVRQQIGGRFFLAGSYNHVYFLPQDSTGYNRFNFLEGESKQPSAAGKYTQTFMFVNVNGTVVF